ncbi:hypothetical protein HKD37_15G043295 [Glycine soja]|nr:hypothetical protein GmHk_15G044542 [Glycine max]
MADDKLFSKCLDRLKAAIANLAVTQASMTTKLDLLLLKMDNLLISQYPSSSSSAKAPPAQVPMLTLLSMPTLSPMAIPLPCLAPMQPSPASLSASLSMPIAPLCLVPMQQSQAPMPAPHLAANSKHQVPHGLSSVFNQLDHVRVVVSLDNLLSVVVHYGHAAVPHDKLLEHRDIALFEMVVESYGSAMVARKRQPVAFALWTAAKLSEFCRDRPWDLGITFGSHGLKPQHLEDKGVVDGPRNVMNGIK